MSTGTEPDLMLMTGLEQLRWIHANDTAATPSIRSLLDMWFTEIERGRIVMELTTRPDFANPQGTVHGGVCATLLDSVMGCAVQSELDAGVGYTTLELKVNYIRPGSLTGQRLIGEGTTVHVGRTTATAQGRVVDESGKLIAHGSTTCIMLR